MSKQMQDRSTGERNSLALVFLVSFAIVSLVSLWLIYQQFAQVFTRTGQCTVLAMQTHQEAIDMNNPDGAQQYAITFTIDLLTADGQHVRTPGYYTSSNYTASDQATIKQIEQKYPVGKTESCGYTYLDPSGIKAIFQPAIPLEGFLFPGFFLVVSLIISGFCVRTLRRRPAPEPPLPDELVEAEKREAGDPQQV